MATLRLRYEKGHFVPLEITDELDDLQDGDVIDVVEWTAAESPISKAELDAYERMLDRTRGLWADWPVDVEGLLDAARQAWDDAGVNSINLP